MPAENRSSNTREQLDALWRDIQDSALRSEDPPHVRFAAAILACPTPQPHPEPIAWMVGTAFWWTKEEAERDAAETGLPIVGLGPMTGISPDEQHQGEPVGTLLIEEYFDNREVGEVDVQLDSKVCEQLAEKYPGQSLPLYTHADPGEVERLHSKIETMRRKNNEYCEEVMSLRAQLAERDALLRDQSGKLIELAARLIQEPLRVLGGYLDNEGPITRNKATHGVEQAGDSLGGLALEVRRVADALSASAEPSAPVAPYPNRLCHIDYTAHPHRCGCLKGDEEAQRRYDEHFRAASTEPSAPTEVDEMAAFENWWHSTNVGDRSTFAAACSAWEARANLEVRPR
ncbi:hypothetical protein [Pseudomonas alloputida]|uniref:hypothetical protein n=1 Tax=Pseudomonas alloputida TaxID=1940621 RepID=UPI001E56CF6B|nr:hypothetical protein [Pseudomonas alloputida]MCE0989365.1 hypothetical protein [Pseudomonas alloputida]